MTGTSTGTGTGTRETPWWRLVAEREVSTRVRERGFQVGLGVTLAFLIGFFVIGTVVGGSTSYDVAVVDDAGSQVVSGSQDALQASGASDDTVTAKPYDDAAAAEQAVQDGDVDAALLPADGGSGSGGYDLVGKDDVDPELVAAVSQTVRSTVLQANAAAQDVDLEALDRGTTVTTRYLDPDAAESGVRETVAFAFSIVFLMTALGYGMTIAQSVVQEKESRVVEILAAAIPIRSLLWGKILGNTVLALGQLLVLVVVGLTGLAVTGRGEVLGKVGPAVVWYVVFFVLGFLALAALWSVAGSLSSRQEDLQSTTLPMQMLLFIPYFVSAFASDKVNEVVSMVPVASSLVMPGRLAQGSVPAWQLAVALGGTLLAAVVFVRVGERLYTRTLLHTGGRLGVRQALRIGEDQ